MFGRSLCFPQRVEAEAGGSKGCFVVYFKVGTVFSLYILMYIIFNGHLRSSLYPDWNYQVRRGSDRAGKRQISAKKKNS